MRDKKGKKWLKENGEEYQDDDIICVDFRTFHNLITSEKHEVAFSYLKKFREETNKVKEAIPKNNIIGYLDGIEMELQRFYLDGEHL